MSQSNHALSLGALPLELLTLIALSSDSTTTILNLSATNKSIFAGLFQAQTFRRLISARRHGADQSDYWDESLIAERAGKDAMLWARFAKADEQAMHTMLRAKEGDTKVPEPLYDWIGELVVAGHPIVKEEHWQTMADEPIAETNGAISRFHNMIVSPLFRPANGRPPQFIYSKTIAILHGVEHGVRPEKVEQAQSRSNGLVSAIQAFIRAATDFDTIFLWVVRNMSFSLHKTIQMRRNVWPFTNNAIHPDLFLPKIDLLPLRRVGDASGYDMPVPFAKACHMNETQSWKVWYKNHTQKLTYYMFEGVWQGYYSNWNETSDPPMTNIQFTPLGDPSDPVVDNIALMFSARDCIDGVGPFHITGKLLVENATGDMKIIAKKQYLRHSWSWILRMTPFGLVGFWGNYIDDQNIRETHGTVWLWKKEWCS